MVDAVVSVRGIPRIIWEYGICADWEVWHTLFPEFEEQWQQRDDLFQRELDRCVAESFAVWIKRSSAADTAIILANRLSDHIQGRVQREFRLRSWKTIGKKSARVGALRAVALWFPKPGCRLCRRCAFGSERRVIDLKRNVVFVDDCFNCSGNTNGLKSALDPIVCPQKEAIQSACFFSALTAMAAVFGFWIAR
jgi:hypothetical protein